MTLRNHAFFSIFLAAALTGCASTSNQSHELDASPVNDFPTQDRVEYVYECVEKHGGLRYETLYPCICSIDKIATKMTYKEYAQAKTFNFLRRTPGEKGAIFRDPPQAKILRQKMEEAQKFAEDSCFVK
ncbi:MAG: hypothetical protein ACU833_07590 [Gammaproteobacteria bacterium]